MNEYLKAKLKHCTYHKMYIYIYICAQSAGAVEYTLTVPLPRGKTPPMSVLYITQNNLIVTLQ